jgi:hypothetical protein
VALAVVGMTLPSLAAESAEGLRDATPAADDSTHTDPVNRGLSLAALVGFGTDAGIDLGVDSSESDIDRPQPDPFGPALGLRAAYTFQPGLVTGASFMHHFGGAPSRATTSAMFEAGWAFAAGLLALEPFVGFGWSSVWITNELCNTVTGECSSSVDSDGGLAASVGLMASLPLSERFFLGARAQALGMVGPELGFSGFASAGVRL